MEKAINVNFEHLVKGLKTPNFVTKTIKTDLRLPKVVFEINEEEAIEAVREFLDGISKLYGAFVTFSAVAGVASAMGDSRAGKDYKKLKKRYARIVDEVPSLHEDFKTKIARSLTVIYGQDINLRDSC